eukprot:TRINITY_DN1510_c0_g1_i1.p2 TRINITY_DN1510_c0_g1~~TRINITY_DN1510_c0_g1_i1.p2  ORF type:complete len:201 (+),score=71.44 TRINITY_DN1510_c0_g1_i1:60-662(+)
MSKRKQDETTGAASGDLLTPPRPSQQTPNKSPQTSSRVSVKRVKVTQSPMNVDLILSNAAPRDANLHDLVRSTPSVLKGLEEADRVLEAYGIFTVMELGNWQVFQMAKSLVSLKDACDATRSTPHPSINLHRGLDSAHETKPLHEILKLPVSTLVALGSRADADFSRFGIHCIEDLALWQPARHAEAMVTLSVYEWPRTL